MKRSVLGLALLLLAARPALALGPHEVALIVNEDSGASLRIAREYAALRRIPAANVVRIKAPTGLAISPDDFTRLIWEPVNRAVEKQGIADHVLAWVYSVGFPIRVSTEPVMSLQGLTFTRNQVPAATNIAKGLWVSPLFAGPDPLGGTAHFAQTLEVYREWLGDDMPLPSMMLGVLGERGMTETETLAVLRAGAAADGTAPTGTVYFVVSEDIRSQCRAWQYPSAVGELQGLNVRAVITSNFPAGARDVMGLLAGAPFVVPTNGNVYLPGCMAEHLTSQAGILDGPDQTKLTAWLKAGTTASAGAVTEPFALWAKFPGARFFVHYAAGCTMIESFFQSIRCPLQILLVGDPLASPWAPAARIELTGVGNGTVRGTVRLGSRLTAGAGYHGSCRFLVDGQVVGTDSYCPLDTTKLTNGRHAVRVVAYRTGLVRSQVFDEREITVANEVVGR